MVYHKFGVELLPINSISSANVKIQIIISAKAIKSLSVYTFEDKILTIKDGLKVVTKTSTDQCTIHAGLHLISPFRVQSILLNVQIIHSQGLSLAFHNNSNYQRRC